MAELDELFSAVRAACSASTWSKAVELVRRLAVSGQSNQDSELLCHVKSPLRAMPYSVQLYVEDAEWACDCDSRAPCCEHVAAAVIAVKKARAEGHALPRGGSHEARLVHRFSRYRTELALQRVLIGHDGAEQPLTTGLAHAVATQSAGVSLSPSQQDLNVDRALGQRVSGPLPPDTAVAVVKLLAAARNVEFEGQPVHVATEILLPWARITDAPGGFNVELSADPRVTEVVATGVALAGDNLHLLGELHSAGPKWESLPSQKHYAQTEVATLVLEVLPELMKRFKVDVQTQALPTLTRDAKPRAVVNVEQLGDKLSVLLTLVYGDPALARVDAGRLVLLKGHHAIPLRDEALEQRVAARAREELGLSLGSRVIVTGDAATQLAGRLDAWRGEVQGSSAGPLIQRQQLSPRLQERQGLLEVNFEGNGENGERLSASPEAVLRAWQDGQRLVPLLTGGFAPLPGAWLDEHVGLLQQVMAARALSKPDAPDGPPHVQVALAQLCQLLDYPAPARLQPLKALLTGLSALPQAALPADLTAELRSYQRQGVNWLNLLRQAGLGAVLADDMGLGKTLQTLCILQGRCLVVCPTSVVHNWAAELNKFRPGLNYALYHGKGRKLDPDAHVTITSYALLRLDQAILTQADWDIAVLDEAQWIKNPESQVAQAAYQLKAKFKLALTGTPVENRLEELWSQFHFTNAGLLGGRADFQARYAEPIRQGNSGAAAALRQRIAPFILRRDKRTVAPELPPRTDLVLYCELGEAERALYTALHAATQRDVVAQLRQGGSVMQALEALLRLRQAACHPALIPGAAANTPAHTAGADEMGAGAEPRSASAKFNALLETLQQALLEGHKALVFSQWTSLLDLLEPELTAASIRFGRLDGSTRDRPGVVQQFQEEAGPPVLLLSLKAGGTGLNLTAADHVFLLDPWWNPAVEQQAADRAHRIGQERPVFVHRLVARGTVEEKILALQQQKRELAAAALEDAALSAGLGRDELLALLE